MRTLRTALDVLLVGLAVVILDFRLNGWDVLPDPVGYGVALAGVLGAMRHGVPPGWGSLAAAGMGVLALLAVPDLLDPPERGNGLRVTPGFDLLAAVHGLAHDATLAALMMGLAALALRMGDALLAQHARRVALAFVVLLGLGVLFDGAVLALDAERWLLVPGLLLALAGLAVYILALVLVWRARSLTPPLLPPQEAAPAGGGT